MRIRSKIVSGLVIAMAVSCAVTGCKKKTQETETASESETQKVTEKETKAETETKNKSTTYKSKDGSLSIKLPDETWEAKKEGTDEWTFESADQGIITIVHYSGEEMQGLIFPASEEEVLDNLEKAGKSKSDYAVVEYKKNTLGSYEAYHTTIKCKSASSKYAYSVAYNLVGDEDIYSVNGQVKQDDAKAMETIRDAVESLKLLKSSGTSGNKEDSTTKKDETDESETADSDNTDNDSENGQYIYDSNGNVIYVYQDSNGNWVDSNGAVYYFSSTGITNSNGASFTYDKPSNNQGGGQTTQTNSFYDNEGNLITVYKNSNGNWVDNNGVVYTFGQYGVTDNYGNYYPYDGNGGSTGGSTGGGSTGGGSTGGGNTGGTGGNSGTGNTNGFYDDQGNYITVYQDSNGNWIDSGGMEYTFGNDGVTDSYGNFDPY